MQRLIIGAPFGNWLDFPQATSTLGTFTARRRGGALYRLWRVLRTVRYYHRLRAWVNCLGLPNPGIDHLVDLVTDPDAQARRASLGVTDKIVSVAGHSIADWIYVLNGALTTRPAAVEMNVSCPNCPGADCSDYREVFDVAAKMARCNRVQLIVKLPPVAYMSLVRLACDAGITGFHCCNTLPTPGGGLSGKPLLPLALQATYDVRNLCHARDYKLDVLVGGGGVQSVYDALLYWGSGANHVAVASLCFFPWRWPLVRQIARTLADQLGPAVEVAPASAALREIGEKPT